MGLGDGSNCVLEKQSRLDLDDHNKEVLDEVIKADDLVLIGKSVNEVFLDLDKVGDAGWIEGRVGSVLGVERRLVFL